MDVLFYEFCGNESFLNYTLLYQDVPVLTECFLDTLPVWISCGFLWIVSLPFTVFMMRSRNKGLTYSVLHIVKMALCLGLACLVQLHFTFRQNYGDVCNGTEVQPDSGQVAMWITFVTFILAAGLIQLQKSFGIKTSGIPFVFWLFLLVAETFRLYSYRLKRVVCGTQIVFYVYYGLIVIQLVVHCWAEKEYVQKPNKIPCPMDGSSILNRITYHWLTSLMYSVYKKRFTRDNMWEQTVTIKSSKVGPRLHDNWQNRLQTYLYTKFRKPPIPEKMDDDLSTSFTESTPLLDVNGETAKGTNTPIETELKRPSLVMTVLRTFMWDIIEFFTYGLINYTLYFSSPIILGMLIDYIEAKSSPGAEPLWIGVTYVVVLCLILEATSVVYNATIHHSMSFGLKVKSALMYLIYKKALTVAKTKDTASVGEVSSLMSVDCQRIQDASTYIYYILLFAFALIGFMWQVIEIVGVPASIAGLAVVILIFPVKVAIAYRQNFLQKQILMTKALRVRMLNEVLSGIKVLKMYAWEPIFQQKIDDIRMKEDKLLRENVILMAVVSTLANQAQFLIHFAIITVYVVLAPDHYISSSVVFVSMGLVVVMKTVVTWLPTVISGMVQVCG